MPPKPSTDRPSLLILRSHIGYPSPDHTDDHEAHGLAFDAEDVTRTKAVIGIPDEPFWAPPELVEAYTQPRWINGSAARSAWAHDNAATIKSDAWTAAWNGGRFPVGSRLCRAPSSARRSPLERRSSRLSTPRCRSSPDCSRERPTSPATPGRSSRISRRRRRTRRAGDSCATACASTGWGRRWSAWPPTAGSCPSAGRSSCSPITCDRRFVWRACRTCGCASCSPTTPSESVRTARRTNRSSSWPRCARSPAST